LVKRLESANGHLYAAGYIDDADGGFLSYPLMRLDGDEWTIASTELAGGAFDMANTDEGLALVGSLFSLTTGSGVQIASFGNDAWLPLADSGDGFIEHAVAWNSGLVVSGNFKSIDGAASRNIALRKGGSWYPLGQGVDGQITALASFAGDLYAAVAGTEGHNATIHRYRNGAWSTLGGTFGESIEAFAVYAGKLYAGGSARTTSGGHAPSLYRLDANQFVPTDIQPDGSVTSLSVSDTAGSTSLYILGDFSFFGDRPSVRIAEYTTCPCPGDVNHDGYVNASDLSVLLARFGRRTDNAYDSGDLTGDRIISSGDLSVLLQRFGAGCG